MSALVAIDPDTKTPGVAFFMGGLLLDAYADAQAFDRLEQLYAMEHGFIELFIECPQTYGGRAAGNSDANDLIKLARVVGRFEQIASGHLGKVTVVTPRAWKGQTPKHICIQRAWDELNEIERHRVLLSPQAFKRLQDGRGLESGAGCDAMDAVALGLRALQRTGRGRLK